MTARGRPRHPDILTPREWSVLELLRQRRTNEEIAEQLGITLDGAKYHVSSILSKLGVASREEAAAWTPEEARRWSAARWALVTAGAGVIVAAVAGLAFLALAVWLSGDDEDAGGLATGSQDSSGAPSDAECEPLGPEEKQGPLGIGWREPGVVCWRDAAGESSYTVEGTVRYWSLSRRESDCEVLPSPLLYLSGEMPFSEQLPADSTRFELPRSTVDWATGLKEFRIEVRALGGDGEVIEFDGTSLTKEPPLCPNFSKIVFGAVRGEGPDFDIYTINMDGSGLSNVTDDPDAPDFFPAWSPDRSRIAYFSFQRTAVTRAPNDPKETTTVQERYLYVMNADGSGKMRLTGGIQSLEYTNPPAWSPDGKRIAFEAEHEGAGEIFVINADGSGLRNVSGHPAHDSGPTWSPDGTQIAFASDRDGEGDIYVAAVDGSGVTRLTTAGGGSPAWSPDGSRIAFFSERDGNSELYVMNSDGSDQVNLSNHLAADFSGAPVGHLPPVWSPDGRMIAFLSDRDGNTELYAVDADGSRLVRLTRTEAGERLALWLPDGESLIFWSGGSLYSMNAFGEGEAQLIVNLDAAVLPSSEE